MVEHGEAIIEDREYYIRIELNGSFNLEGARRYLTQYREHVQRRAEKPFGILVNSNHYTGLSPDAAHLSDEFNDWLNCINGFVGKAIVSNSQAILNVSYFMQPATSVQRKQIFSDEAEAERWLIALVKDEEG